MNAANSQRAASFRAQGGGADTPPKVMLLPSAAWLKKKENTRLPEGKEARSWVAMLNSTFARGMSKATTLLSQPSANDCQTRLQFFTNREAKTDFTFYCCAGFNS